MPSLFNELAYDQHEAQLYQGGNLEFFYIDPQAFNSAKVNGLNTFSIQVHNVSATSSDLTIKPYLLIGVKDTSITFFPIAVETNLHTNFNIDSSPFRLKLFVYSKDSTFTIKSGVEAMYLEVEIKDTEEVVELPDFEVIK